MIGGQALATGHAGTLHEQVLALREELEYERLRREQLERQLAAVTGDLRAVYGKVMQMAAQLDQAYIETITALARAVEARDQHTGAHVERVRAYCVGIAEHLAISGDARRQLEFGAVLHDVGKIGVRDAVLTKRSALAEPEWLEVRQHPDIGLKLLGDIPFLAGALEAVAAHHERWDGAGYPRGLSGDSIPLAGRIVAVADAFDAMTTDRPYRKAREAGAALDEIARGAGTQFDRRVVEAFLQAPPGLLRA
jgi:putative two-component system response regulator